MKCLKKVEMSNKQQYFLYLMSLALIVLIFISTFYYFYFSFIMKNNAKVNGRNTLSLLENSQNLFIEEIEKMFMSLALNPTITQDIGSIENPNVLHIMAVNETLKNTIASSDYVHSMFIYYKNDNCVFSTQQGLARANQFYDSEYLNTLISNRISKNYFDIRNVTDSSNFDGETTVLTFVNSIPISSVDPDMLIVTNIKYDYLKTGINSIQQNRKSGIVILNNVNKLLCKFGIGELLSDEDAIRLKKASEIRIDGKKILVSSVHSEKYQWYFCYLTILNSIWSDISFVITFIILIVLLVICISIMSNRLSLQLYLPVQKVFMQIEPKDCNGNVNELQYIHDNVGKLIDKNKKLENLLSEYRLYQRNMYLKSIVEGSITEGYDNLNYYGIDVIQHGYFIVYAVSMDNYKDFLANYSAQQQEMYLMYQREILSEYITENHCGFVVNIDNNKMVVVLNLPDEANVSELKEEYYKTAVEIKKLLSQSNKHTFTIGVGTFHKDIGSIANCYTEADEALNYNFIFGLDTVILYENISMYQTENEYPLSLEKNILKGLKVGNRDMVFSTLNQFENYFCSNLSDDVEVVRTHFIQLYSTSYKTCQHLFKDNDQQFHESYKILMNSVTIHDMVEKISEFFNVVLQANEEKSRFKNKELLERVTEYIDHHLNSDLQMERIAEHFYISASYLRKLFKEGTGETIKEYIDAKRMWEAKRLLRATDQKISQIASATGYLSIQAFATAFKTNTGLTPSEYRTKSKKADIQKS